MGRQKQNHPNRNTGKPVAAQPRTVSLSGPSEAGDLDRKPVLTTDAGHVCSQEFEAGKNYTNCRPDGQASGRQNGIYAVFT
jgi:hypothetical protein